MRGTKRLDLYELARVDRQYPVEENIKTIAEFVAEEKVGFIGMSECRAETLRRGHSVHPIAVVEIEVSPWSYDQNVKDGKPRYASSTTIIYSRLLVIQASKDLGVAVAAYSYVCHFLRTFDPVPSAFVSALWDVAISPASLRTSVICTVRSALIASCSN